MQLGNRYSKRALEWLFALQETDRSTWAELFDNAVTRDFVGFMAAAQGELSTNSEAVFGKGCTSQMVMGTGPAGHNVPLNYKWLFDMFVRKHDPSMAGGYDPARAGAERTVQR